MTDETPKLSRLEAMKILSLLPLAFVPFDKAAEMTGPPAEVEEISPGEQIRIIAEFTFRSQISVQTHSKEDLFGLLAGVPLEKEFSPNEGYSMPETLALETYRLGRDIEGAWRMYRVIPQDKDHNDHFWWDPEGSPAAFITDESLYLLKLIQAMSRFGFKNAGALFTLVKDDPRPSFSKRSLWIFASPPGSEELYLYQVSGMDHYSDVHL